MYKLIGFLVVTALFGCSKSVESKVDKADTRLNDRKDGSKSKDDKVIKTPTEPKKVVVEVKMPAGATSKVRVQVPGDWVPVNNGMSGNNQYGEAVSGVSFQVTCDGECTASKLPAALKSLIEGMPQSARKPNLNTGDAKLDAVRLDVNTTEKGELPDGAFVTFTVKKPVGLVGPYREQVVAACGRLHPAKDRFVVARAWAPIDKSKELGDTVANACKTFEILP